MLPNPPQAVIFDMDGVLLDSEAIYCKVWCQAATELGYSMCSEDYLHFLGRRTEDCKQELINSYGHDFPLENFLAMQDVLYEQHRVEFGLPLKSGVIELLDYLEQLQVPTGVATSTHRSRALQYLGELANRFDAIATGDEVERGKPAPDIFLLAAHRLQVQPQHCLVLEDADNGSQAALAAGMSLIFVPDLKPPSANIAEQAACICGSLHEVKELISSGVG